MPSTYLRLGSSPQASQQGPQAGALRQNRTVPSHRHNPIPCPCRCCLVPVMSHVALASVPGAPLAA